MSENVVITGLGMVTPLGENPADILESVRLGISAAATPSFDVSQFDCRVYAPIEQFDARKYFPENKALRLMNRDSQLAVTAARFAMNDAGVMADREYRGEDIALYGATGAAGMAVEEIAGIIKYAASDDGTLSLERFGRIALRRVRPVLSFKILANMPVCFVSIFENIRGPNAVYTPWQGQGAQAIVSGIRAISRGEASCALVGGCDVRTRELSFVNLQQLGMFESWKRYGKGAIPGEGAVFILLESERCAIARNRKCYARICHYAMRSVNSGVVLAKELTRLVSQLDISQQPAAVIAAGDGDVFVAEAESEAMERAGLKPQKLLRPRAVIGDLYAASATAQLAIGARLAGELTARQTILVNCFGCGSEQGCFILEAA